MSPHCRLLIQFLKAQLINGELNGELHATHRQLEITGIPYPKIKATINEAVALELVKVKHGHVNTFTLLARDAPIKRARL